LLEKACRAEVTGNGCCRRRPASRTNCRESLVSHKNISKSILPQISLRFSLSSPGSYLRSADSWVTEILDHNGKTGSKVRWPCARSAGQAHEAKGERAGKAGPQTNWLALGVLSRMCVSSMPKPQAKRQGTGGSPSPAAERADRPCAFARACLQAKLTGRPSPEPSGEAQDGSPSRPRAGWAGAWPSLFRGCASAAWHGQAQVKRRGTSSPPSRPRASSPDRFADVPLNLLHAYPRGERRACPTDIGTGKYLG
jgi:hypothetical protein